MPEEAIEKKPKRSPEVELQAERQAELLLLLPDRKDLVEATLQEAADKQQRRLAQELLLHHLEVEKM